MTEPLYVSILWHMHQPFYKDPVRGECLLPWSYLHAVKDYYDMAAIVDQTPGAKVTFNLVPSLLEQIRDYAEGRVSDPFLAHARMLPAEMNQEQRRFLLENFFSANRQRMIEPYRRYLELYNLIGPGAPGVPQEPLRLVRDQELLDLQVWFYLSWTGEAARRKFPLFRKLIRKGKHFSQEEKLCLLESQRQLISEIIPLYGKLHREGKAELSVSPYYHPILPLLCDSRIARVALPKASLPDTPFRYPEDARSQVAQGLASFEEIFGFRPKGMWPSEGAVSDEALSIMARHGLSWSASDELILSQSLAGGLGREHEALYRPYLFQHEGRDLALFFRDHALSDLIGFTYSQWDPDRAVDDLVARLLAVRQRCHGSRVVPIILDGENAWEYFRDNGFSFLTRLYREIAASRTLAAATFSEVLDLVPERRTLGRIHPGSWVNASYGIWIGHPEKNLAWDYLAQARAAAVAKSPAVAVLLGGAECGDETASLVCKALYAAEGSDWFWWYGDDHYSAHAAVFDLLFRRHLINVYQLLGLEAPRELHEPIKKQFRGGFVRAPEALISPTITGIVTDYFEWLAAGLYDLTRLSSALHLSESPLQSFYYGYDRDYFYFRVDGVTALDKLLEEGDRLSLHLLHGEEFVLEMQKGTGVAQLMGTLCAEYSIARIAEARVPLETLKLLPGDRLSAYLTLTRQDQEIGRWPLDTPLPLQYLGPQLKADQEALSAGEASRESGL